MIVNHNIYPYYKS